MRGGQRKISENKTRANTGSRVRRNTTLREGVTDPRPNRRTNSLIEEKGEDEPEEGQRRVRGGCEKRAEQIKEFREWTGKKG